VANGRPVRADVVEAAIAVFREKGYERATVREIADRAGLGTSTLYFHVKSKEELYLAAVRPVLEQGTEWMEALVTSDLPPLEKIRAAIVRAVELYDHHPEIVIYLREFFSTADDAFPDLVERSKRAWTTVVGEVLADQHAPTDFDPKLIAYALMGLASWMHRWYRLGGPRTATEIGELYADFLLHGLRARPGE
jgi:AcrR family transcriptional regulator